MLYCVLIRNRPDGLRIESRWGRLFFGVKLRGHGVGRPPVLASACLGVKFTFTLLVLVIKVCEITNALTQLVCPTLFLKSVLSSCVCVCRHEKYVCSNKLCTISTKRHSVYRPLKEHAIACSTETLKETGRVVVCQNIRIQWGIFTRLTQRSIIHFLHSSPTSR
jgi:hypothetical protein